MRRILATFVTAVLVLAPMTADAQRRRSDPGNGGRGFFLAGVQALDIDDLNETLALNGYPTFSERFVSLGGTGFGIRDQLIIGGEGHAVFQSSETTNDGTFRVRVAGGYGMFNVGYMAVRHGRFSLYPILGIGGGGMSLSIQERSTVDFDDLLDEPRRGVVIDAAALLVGGAIGLDYVFPTSESGRGGVAISLRAGMNYAPLDPDWNVDGVDVANGPDASFTGPYLRIGIGGGSR